MDDKVDVVLTGETMERCSCAEQICLHKAQKSSLSRPLPRHPDKTLLELDWLTGSPEILKSLSSVSLYDTLTSSVLPSLVFTPSTISLSISI